MPPSYPPNDQLILLHSLSYFWGYELRTGCQPETCEERERERERERPGMDAVSSNRWFSSVVKYPIKNEVVLMKMKKKICFCNSILGSKKKLSSNKTMGISCKTFEGEVEGNTTSMKRRSDFNTSTNEDDDKMEEYNTAMKRMMRNPYEYHHDLGMNYALIVDSLIVGSQPQKPEDINHLKEEQNVAYILNLQQDKDVEFWGIDLQSIIKRCKELGIRHMRRPAKDFDPDSLRNGLPKAVSSLEWAISEGKGRVYVHCTAGLGRAPAVAIAYMFWFCGMNLNTAYDTLTSRRPCGPNRDAIRGATYDLAKNDPWKESFENLPEHAFEDIADWERKLIQDRVRSLRGT